MKYADVILPLPLENSYTYSIPPDLEQTVIPGCRVIVHFGKDKVFMDFAFFAIAFNIKKMCAKMTKEGVDWLIRLFYELTAAVFRCREHINQRNPQKIAA